MILMNKDVEVLWFDSDDYLIKILNPKMLPYYLMDNIKDSEQIKSIAEGIKNYDKLRHFFADRVLSMSRENAKQLLISIQNKQRLSEEDSYRLSLKCRGVSINDSFWVKGDEENLSFSDVNIREQSLSDVVFQIAMKGTPISIQHSFLVADITTKGMFMKTWKRKDGKLLLYKSDRTTDKVNTNAEVYVSRILENSSVNHVKYKYETVDDLLCCVCECFTNDNVSFVEAEYVKGYLERQNKDFLNFISDNFRTEFANMVVCDYLFGNPDEHENNWGFLVNNKDNRIVDFAPLFDNNMATIIFKTHKEKEFDELIYEPTGKSMFDSACEWYPYSNLGITELPEFLEKRLAKIISSLKRSDYF